MIEKILNYVKDDLKYVTKGLFFTEVFINEIKGIHIYALFLDHADWVYELIIKLEEKLEKLYPIPVCISVRATQGRLLEEISIPGKRFFP